MAWDHNARNRSAEVRQVNYHENGSSRSGSGGGNNQGPNKLFNTIAGGLVIFLLGSAGLSVVTEGIGMIGDTIGLVSDLGGVSKSSKPKAKTQKEIDKELERVNKNRDTEARKPDAGEDYIKLTTDDIEFDIEAEDVAELLETLNEELSETSDPLQIEEKIIAVDPSIIYDDLKFKELVIDRANSIPQSVTFVVKWPGTIILSTAEEDLAEISNKLDLYEDLIDWGMHKYINCGGRGDAYVKDGCEYADYIYYMNFFN